MQADFIQLINLTMKVGGHTLLDRANCVISRGEYVAIIGANGVGKTSFLRLLGGLLKHDHGRLQMPTAIIGYAPDTPPTYPYDTVNSYLRFVCQLKNASLANIAECLQILDLESVSNKKIITLSKGTRQRVNLAQAIISKPELLLLDEPTNGLDIENCTNFCNYLKTLQQQGTTIVIASHQYSDFVQNCDYMLKIQNQAFTKILTPIINNFFEVVHDKYHHTS